MRFGTRIPELDCHAVAGDYVASMPPGQRENHGRALSSETPGEGLISELDGQRPAAPPQVSKAA